MGKLQKSVFKVNYKMFFLFKLTFRLLNLNVEKKNFGTLIFFCNWYNFQKILHFDILKGTVLRD
jgi:hypothetical protein